MKNQRTIYSFKIFLSTIISIFIFTCCSDVDTGGKVLIRIQNLSNFDYEEVYVSSGSGQNNFGDIAAHKASVYKVFESAYRYGYIELEIDGDKYFIQPIDYVGESLLEPGRYTYKINASESGDQYDRLSLTFKED